MITIVISLVLRLSALMTIGALSQRYALEGEWPRAVLSMGFFIALFRGAFLRAIEFHMLLNGRTPSLVSASRFIQSPEISMVQDIVILVGAVMVFLYYYNKAKDAIPKTK